MAAASLDDFCRCCRKLIENKDKFYLKLFGEKSSREGIAEAVRKYVDINIREEDIGAVSTSICRSCYLLVKCIMEKTAKFYSVCHLTIKTSKWVINADLLHPHFVSVFVFGPLCWVHNVFRFH